MSQRVVRVSVTTCALECLDDNCICILRSTQLHEYGGEEAVRRGANDLTLNRFLRER
jgi:hypothetical protein